MLLKAEHDFSNRCNKIIHAGNAGYELEKEIPTPLN